MERKALCINFIMSCFLSLCFAANINSKKQTKQFEVKRLNIQSTVDDILKTSSFLLDDMQEKRSGFDNLVQLHDKISNLRNIYDTLDDEVSSYRSYKSGKAKSRMRRTSYVVSAAQGKDDQLNVYFLRMTDQDSCDEDCTYNVTYWEFGHKDNATSIIRKWGTEHMAAITDLKPATLYQVYCCIMNNTLRPDVYLHCNTRNATTNERISDNVKVDSTTASDSSGMSKTTEGVADMSVTTEGVAEETTTSTTTTTTQTTTTGVSSSSTTSNSGADGPVNDLPNCDPCVCP